MGDEIVLTILLRLHDAGNVVHRIHGLACDGLDFRELVLHEWIVLGGSHDVLADENDTAQTAADLVVEILRDALTQRVNFQAMSPALAPARQKQRSEDGEHTAEQQPPAHVRELTQDAGTTELELREL